MRLHVLPEFLQKEWNASDGGVLLPVVTFTDGIPSGAVNNCAPPGMHGEFSVSAGCDLVKNVRELTHDGFEKWKQKKNSSGRG